MTGDSLRIGDLARESGVPIRTIRFYSDAGLLAPAGRTAARYRLYGPADRLRLEQIRILRELGFGLDAVAALLGRAADARVVIDAQLRAIERDRSHLARAAAVLRAALAGGDPADATLRVGAILKLAAWQRAGALRETLAAPLRKTAVDPAWLDRLLDAAFAQIPDELDDDQWDAFVELVAIVTDPAFGISLAAQADPWWRRARRFDAMVWERDFTALVRRGAEAVRDGAGPDDRRVAALADAYLAMLARATGRRPTRALIATILRAVDDHDPRAERFWDLVARLHRRPPPPHGAVMRLVFAALRRRLQASPRPRVRGSDPARARSGNRGGARVSLSG